MQESNRKPGNYSLTPDKEPKASRQGSVGDILQAYQARMQGRQLPHPENTDVMNHLKPETAPVQTNAVPFTVQRKPADFMLNIPPGIASVALFKTLSNWGKIENAIEAYSNLNENNIPQREESLRHLVELISLYQHNLDTNDTAHSKRDARNDYCTDILLPLIGKEYVEINQAGGNLKEGEAPAGRHGKKGKDCKKSNNMGRKNRKRYKNGDPRKDRTGVTGRSRPVLYPGSNGICN